MAQNNINNLIKKTYEEYSHEIEDIKNIEVPNIDITMVRFHNAINKKSTKTPLNKKLVIAAGFVLIFFTSTLVSSLPEVKAAKFTITKMIEELRSSSVDVKITTSDGPLVQNINTGNNLTANSNIHTDKPDQIDKLVSFEEAEKEVPYKILSPNYLPHGFKVDTIKLTITIADYYAVEQTYINSIGNRIEFYQRPIPENSASTISFNKNNRIEDISINGLKIKLVSDDEHFKNALWIKDHMKYEVLALYNISDEEFIKIIKELK